MKNSIFTLIFLITAIIFAHVACNKKDTFPANRPGKYLNLQVGKYILYELDSVNYIGLNSIETSYQAKDVVDASITDNEGRPGWRIIRYLRSSSSTDEADWQPLITYSVTVLSNAVEVVEDNQRYIKLKAPVIENFSWRGNTYIDPETFPASYGIELWDYTYENVDMPFVFADNRVVDNTVTVNQRDEILGDPDVETSFSARNFSKEVYAKDVGLIYKEFLHWEYQPANEVDDPNYVGEGIKLTMIDHN